jgi:hypothetical protein
MDLTDPQQWNGYAYGNNSPFTFSDPSGLAYCDTNVCAGDPGYNPAGPRNNSNGGCVSNCGASHNNYTLGSDAPAGGLANTNKAAYVPPASCSQFGYHAKDACVGAQSYAPSAPMTESEVWHGVFDLGGIFFEPADAANCALYVSEGNYGDAALSCAGLVPVAGILATVAKSWKNFLMWHRRYAASKATRSS